MTLLRLQVSDFIELLMSFFSHMGKWRNVNAIAEISAKTHLRRIDRLYEEEL